MCEILKLAFISINLCVMLEPFFSVFSSLECHIFQPFHKLIFCLNVLRCFAFTFFFATGFLILSGHDGVIFDVDLVHQTVLVLHHILASSLFLGL